MRLPQVQLFVPALTAGGEGDSSADDGRRLMAVCQTEDVCSSCLLKPALLPHRAAAATSIDDAAAFTPASSS